MLHTTAAGIVTSVPTVPVPSTHNILSGCLLLRPCNLVSQQSVYNQHPVSLLEKDLTESLAASVRRRGSQRGKVVQFLQAWLYTLQQICIRLLYGDTSQFLVAQPYLPQHCAETEASSHNTPEQATASDHPDPVEVVPWTTIATLTCCFAQFNLHAYSKHAVMQFKHHCAMLYDMSSDSLAG